MSSSRSDSSTPTTVVTASSAPISVARSPSAAPTAPTGAPLDPGAGNLPEIEIEAGVGNQDFDHSEYIERLNKRIHQYEEISKRLWDEYRSTGSYLDANLMYTISTARGQLGRDIKASKNLINKLHTPENDPKKSSQLRSDVERFLKDSDPLNPVSTAWKSMKHFSKQFCNKLFGSITPAESKPISGLPEPEPGPTPGKPKP